MKIYSVFLFFNNLSVRVHVCPECGLILKRDHVSATIIGNRGTTTVPTDCGELKPAESSQWTLRDAGSPSIY
ncbi:MAG: hypothetical protein FIB07_05235 [Candidatus Methanoperedens sp.]|nr:hypothetical protein [Candidatus Methanoperedens sp.]